MAPFVTRLRIVFDQSVNEPTTVAAEPVMDRLCDAEAGYRRSHAGVGQTMRNARGANPDGDAMSWLGPVLALCCAVVNAVANVLQRAANRAETPDLAFRPRLILDLLRRPLWLAGIGAVIVSFLFQASALRFGTLAGVQPIIILELPLTLIGAAIALNAEIGRKEWWGTGAAALGVALFLIALAPSGGNNGSPSGGRWILAGTSTVLAIGAVVLAGVAAKGGRRAALLGLATGMTFGFTAAFMKGMTAHFGQGVIGVLTAWPTYAMVAAGLTGMYLLQNALHAGPLVACQPGITLADPAVALLWGTLVFHESIRGGAALLLVVAGVALVAIGTVGLTRSPLLADRELSRRDRRAAAHSTSPSKSSAASSS